MDTTAVKRAAGLETREADRLREELGQLRGEVARLSADAGASASRGVRFGTAAARSGAEQAQRQALALGRRAGGEVKARPLTVAAALTVLGLLALAACLRSGVGEHRG